MTVCIGAIFEAIGRVFFVADSLGSDQHGSMSMEGIRKHAELDPTGRWVALFSDNVSEFDNFVRYVVEQQVQREPTETQVIAACEAAYRRIINKRVEATVLRPWNMTVDDFAAKGRQCFGDERFDKITQKIAKKQTVQLEILVVGIDAQFPYCRMFIIGNDGIAYPQNSVGYCVIGAGGDIAGKMLDQLDFFNHLRDVDEIVYRLCAAKFAAENATSVGSKNTNIVSISHTGMWSSIWAEDVEKLRKMWLKEKVRTPKRAISHIHETFLDMPALSVRGIEMSSRPKRKR